MITDLLYASPFVLFFGWVFIEAFRIHKGQQETRYKLQFCPTCHAEFKSQAWQDDLSGQMGERLIKMRYCPNGHSWAVRRHSVSSGESVIDRLGGWQP